MKKLFTILSVLSCLTSQAQTTTEDFKFKKLNTFSLELGGPGIQYGLNYERVLINGHRFKTTAQFGISYYPPSASMRNLWMPITINEVYSFNAQHHLEIGFGAMLVADQYEASPGGPSTWELEWMLTARLGYRYVSKNNRFTCRFGITPVLEEEFHFLVGASIGYSF